jgi:hypothetical protein
MVILVQVFEQLGVLGDFELHWAKSNIQLGFNSPSKFVICACLNL